jgi:hypothetical protein
MMLMHAIVSLDPDGQGLTVHDVFKDYATMRKVVEKGRWSFKSWVPLLRLGSLDLAKSVRPENVEWWT